MHNINDLTQLLNLLEGDATKPIEFSLDPSLRESLQGCLTLGIRNLLDHAPGALPPRSAERFVNKRGDIPKMLVKITDFEGLVAGTADLSDMVKVSGNLMQNALGWVEECCRAPRIEKILNELDAQVERGPDVIDVPSVYLQEIIDWLDQIQRNDPNDLADEIREDVKQLNGREMMPKIKWTNYTWD